MKKSILMAACSMAALGAIAGSAFADDALSTCTLESLHGTMAWHVTKTKNGVPLASAGMESYDGKGHLKYVETDSDGFTTVTYPGTGTYTITSDCMATVTYDGGTDTYLYYVAPDGSAYYWANDLNNGTVASGRADRVTKGLVVK